MDKLKLNHTRIKEIIEPNTIYKTYKGLVMDYYTELFSDYKNIQNEWMFQYYKSSYEKMMDLCNEFLDNEFKLNIPFENACKLYNSYSRMDFDKFLKLDEDITSEVASYRINFILMRLTSIMTKIFKESR